MRVALADGTVAKSGGKVIKNVAGYDLAKLFTGSFGTLGAILEVSVRLHPLPPATATAVGHTQTRDLLGRGAAALRTRRSSSLGSTCAGRGGAGTVLARFGGVPPRAQAEAAERLLREAGLEAELVEDDDPLWQAQRDGQRSPPGSWCACRRCRRDLPRARCAPPSATAPRWSGRAGARPVLAAPRRGDAAALSTSCGATSSPRVLDRPAGPARRAGRPRDPGMRALSSA